MRLGWKVAVALTGLILLVTVAGYLLPNEAAAPETVVTLDASSAELFPLFNSRVGHRQVWALASQGSGGTMSLADLGGPDRGVGARMCFCLTGEGLGPIASWLSRLVDGDGVIVESEATSRVVYAIDFGFVAVRRTIHFEQIDERTTRVTWLEVLEASNPLERYILLASSQIRGFDFVLEAAGQIVAAERETAAEGEGAGHVNGEVPPSDLPYER